MVMCNWVQNRMPAYMSGELGKNQVKWLEWHVRQCHVCQKALRMLKGMQQVVAKALSTDLRAPETLDARVMAAIDALPRTPPSAPNSPPQRRSWRWWRRE